jgi:CheY-like chemotaxis protein
MTKSVLVAEDDKELREAIAWALRAEGYRVVTASDGLEALRIMQQSGALLAVLDLRMPWTNGLEVIARMRRDPVLQRIPLLVLTGFPQEAPRDLAVLTKPFSGPRLLEMVQAIIGKPAWIPSTLSNEEN